jgi:putative transposase
MGRPRADPRRCLDGILYRARTGCQWNQLPNKFGSDATVHRTLQRWESKGIFDIVWTVLVYHVEALGGVHWEWQAADGMLNKARFIGNGQKGGSSRTLRTRESPNDGRGNGRWSIPL